MKHLAKIRASAGLLVLAGIVTLFVVPIGWTLMALGWLTRAQLVPAVLALDAAILAVLLASVLLFGRVYCSVVCPLGISQDVVRGAVRLVARKLPNGPRRSTGKVGLIIRWAVLALFALGVGLGATGFIEPYGIFGRFMSVGIFRAGSPAPLVIGWSVGLFAAIVLVGLWRARWWCNQVCPVGTLLGLLGRFALVRVRIDRAACVNCNRCVVACDKGVISSEKDKTVDISRCVACFNCAGSCAKGALTFLPRKGAK